jgi:2-polyprenyl-3-methyl-5-hydroxy-6-metoxy-1,4-benzoquinol methylase
MLLSELPATHGAMKNSMALSQEDSPQQTEANQELSPEDCAVHPSVQRLVGATCGIMYRNLVGDLPRYPIPNIRIPAANGQRLLDVGCNWGRWSIAAARKGYHVVGVDPDLGALRAARDVAKQLGISVTYVAGDARRLPFRNGAFDRVFSYSVLQHFCREDLRQVLASVRKVLKPGGRSLIQMANAFGIRCMYHQARRGFRRPRDFEVRYWTAGELRREFTRLIGTTSISVDGFFGLGIQGADADILPLRYRAIISASELLRAISLRLPALHRFADSLYLESVSSTSCD